MKEEERMEKAPEQEEEQQLHEKPDPEDEAGAEQTEKDQMQENEAVDGQVVSEIKQKLEEKEKQYEELMNSYTRLQADFDNFRKRSRKEKEDTLRFAAEGMITELLPVLDNFQRALSAEDDSEESLKSGIEMIYRELHQVLEKQGLQEIPAQGEQFDPNLHQAVMQLETDEHPHNTVVQELQKGYTLKGKVIRPSMVQVADNPGTENK